MPRGIRVRHDLEAMIELVIRERKIALPTTRLAWYARWFGIPVSEQHVANVCNQMWKEGKLKKIKDGRWTYWKNRR